jgi:tRNA(Ile)-lysidine synthase
VTKEQAPCARQQLSAASQALLPVSVWSNHRVLVAVSGGADSVALFRTISELRNELAPSAIAPEVVHVNHGIREGAADRDVDFVKNLAKTFDAKFHLKAISWVSGGAAEPASENDLRELRYDAILEVAREIGARYVFTGHHQGDQVETILFRIFRGTGMAGLTGIPAVRVVDETVSLVRPLLEVQRETILAALAAWNQDYCHDESNDGDGYSRNFLRNTLLPQVRDYFGPHVDQSILRLAQHASDSLQLEQARVQDFFVRHHIDFYVENGKRTTVFARNDFRDIPPMLVRAILIEVWRKNGWPLGAMTSVRWHEISALILQDDRCRVLNLPSDLRFEVDLTQILVTETG